MYCIVQIENISYGIYKINVNNEIYYIISLNNLNNFKKLCKFTY